MFGRLAAQLAVALGAALVISGCERPSSAGNREPVPDPLPTGPPSGPGPEAPVVTRPQPTAPATVAAQAASAGPSRNTTEQSFSKAKKALRRIYAGHEVTLYCGCRYGGITVDLQSCGYVPKRDDKRAHQVEWEHVVAAHAFGQSFKEWRDGDPTCVDRKGKPFAGRNCARKASVEFRYMEADMYNLYPAIGEVNAARSNYSMALIPGEAREFGACDVEIADRKFEPRPAIRGDIARTYLYMDAAYPGRAVLSKKNRPMFEAWAAEDPVDAWECERARRIEKIQGNANAVVMAACQRASL